MSTLPLKAISRVWGKFNELEIPYYLRVPGFKLYSWIFGVKYVERQASLPINADSMTVYPKSKNQTYTPSRISPLSSIVPSSLAHDRWTPIPMLCCRPPTGR